MSNIAEASWNFIDFGIFLDDLILLWKEKDVAENVGGERERELSSKKNKTWQESSS